MRYSDKILHSHGAIKLLICFLLILTGLFTFFVFSYNAEQYRKAGENLPEEYGSSELSFPVGCYEKLLKTGNIPAGGMFQSDFINSDIVTQDEDGTFVTRRYDNAKTYILATDRKSPAITVGEYTISISEDNVEFCYLYGDNYYNTHENPAKEYVNEENINYKEIASLLQKQHVSEIKIMEISTLLSFTVDNVLLNFDGETAVFAKKTTNNESDFVEFITVDKNGYEEVSQKYEFSKNVPVMCSNNYCFFANGNQFFVLPLNNEDKITSFSCDKEIVSINYAEDLLSNNVYFLTDDTLYCFKSYDKVETITPEESECSSGVIYINHSDWFDGAFSEITYVLVLNKQEDNGFYSLYKDEEES